MRGPAGVGHAGDRRNGSVPLAQVTDQRLDDRQQPLRSDGAVCPDGGNAQPVEPRGDLLRRAAADGAAVLGEGHRGDDRQVARLARGADRLRHLVQAADRLQHEEVDASLEQRLDLLAKRRAHRLRRDDAEGRQGAPGRTDRARHQRRATSDLTRFACQAHRLLVDLAHPVGEPERLQFEAIGAKGIRLQQVRAGVEIGAVRVEDELGTGEIERVERLVEGRPGGIEHGADGAIGEDRSSGESVEQRMGHRGTPGSNRIAIAQLYPTPTG